MKFLRATSAKEIARQRHQAETMTDLRTTDTPPGEAGSRFPTPHSVGVRAVSAVKAAILPGLVKDGETRALRRSIATEAHLHRRIALAANAYTRFHCALGHDTPKLLLPHEFDSVITVYPRINKR